MKRKCSIAVLKDRLSLAAMINCRAGGTRRANMVSLAEHVGVYDADSDIEIALCSYIRNHIDERHAKRLLTWMITKASYQNERARPPICIPKVQEGVPA